ncbi:MAG: hypothetical protein BGO67_00615 [Alphaproteobacteria bacterium 41-28]|jgi:hypothetical protein|nr:MAG: hypothetical protein BGO67_00615 [Alphaproteobacteria bacterium 41-28]
MRKFNYFKTKFIAYNLILSLIVGSFPLHAMTSDYDFEIWNNGTNHVRCSCKCDNNSSGWEVYGYPAVIGFVTAMAGVIAEEVCQLGPKLINCCKRKKAQ